MKLLSLLLCVTAALAEPLQDIMQQSQYAGIDVSANNINVTWNVWEAKGYTFAFIKATGGASYTNPDFLSQYTGAAKANLIRGAYHLADPSESSGRAQASYFLKHGGGWSPDGITLPGALVLEDNWCYGKTPLEMVSWIKNFSTKYHHSTGRYPVLSVGSDQFWERCTGNSHAFAHNPLWFVHLGTSIGTLPGGWSHATFWQFGEFENTNIDKFRGDLKRFALGH